MKFGTNKKQKYLSTPLEFYQTKFTSASSLKHEHNTFFEIYFDFAIHEKKTPWIDHKLTKEWTVGE